jgi:hypothetical protein
MIRFLGDFQASGEKRRGHIHYRFGASLWNGMSMAILLSATEDISHG